MVLKGLLLCSQMPCFYNIRKFIIILTNALFYGTQSFIIFMFTNALF
jgi:hypothetical protein